MAFLRLPGELRHLIYHYVAISDLTLYPRHGHFYKRHPFLHVNSQVRSEFEDIAKDTRILDTATVKKHYGALFSRDFAMTVLDDALTEFPDTLFTVVFTVAMGREDMCYVGHQVRATVPWEAGWRMNEIAKARYNVDKLRAVHLAGTRENGLREVGRTEREESLREYERRAQDHASSTGSEMALVLR